MSSTYYKPDDPNLMFIQSRAEIDLDLVEEYAQMMLDGVQFDAVQAVADEKTIYVYDGFHRGEAARKTKQLLLVSARPGSQDEARWLALAANQRHGMRRSIADREKIVKLALMHPFGAKLSDRQVANHCGVSHPFVSKIRGELEVTGNISSQIERTGADGRVINTAGISASNVDRQPDYVSIVALEQGVRRWVTGKYPIPQGQVETLRAIKERRDEGPALLEGLLTGDVLPGPHRKGDVIQAVNNVLSQLQAAAPAPEPSAAPADPEPAGQQWLDEPTAEPARDAYPTGYPATEKTETETPPSPPPVPAPAPAPAPPPPPPPPPPRPQTPPDWLLTVTFKHTGICLATLTQAGQTTPAANLSTHKDTVLAQIGEALEQHVPFYTNGKETA